MDKESQINFTQQVGGFMMSLQSRQQQFNELVSISSYLVNRTAESMPDTEAIAHRVAARNIITEALQVVYQITNDMLGIVKVVTRATVEVMADEVEVPGSN